MQYIIDHIPESTKCNRRPGTKMVPTSITIHNTGNPTSKARDERGWLTNPNNDRTASWHIAIDDKEAIESIPLNEVAWHAGNYEGNRTSISIEVCESGDQEKVWKNAVYLTTKLLFERGWGVEQVKTHQNWSGKYCPRLILPKWDKFLQDVEAELKNLSRDNQSAQASSNSQASSWAISAQKWVMENRISDGTNPKTPATREQVWVMLYNLMGGKEND